MEPTTENPPREDGGPGTSRDRARPGSDPAWQPLRQRPHGAWLFVSLAVAGLIALATLWGFSQLATKSPGKLNLGGDRRFVVKGIDRTARTIERGGPILLPALPPSKVDLFLQHLGDDRYIAFSALAPGKGRECALVWQPATAVFDDPCSDATYPADGTGLTAYFVAVDTDADVIEIDPRRPLGAAATTDVPATSS